jgi:pyruvate dehydrogenase E1 component beta subunit
MFAQIPGLKVVMPSTPYDAKGLLLSAIKDDTPVLFVEHRWLYQNTGAVPEELYALPIGKAAHLHRGDGVTVVAASLAAIHALQACENESLDVDLVDPRTIKPLDLDTITASVERTGRLLVIDYDFPFAGFAAEVCAAVTERCFRALKAPPQRMAFPDRSMPSSGVLERAYYPNPDRIAATVHAMLADSHTPVAVS